MIALATDAVDTQELHHPQKYNIPTIVGIAIILGIVSTLFDLICFGFFMYKQEGLMQSGWFLESVLTEIVFIFSVRTRMLFFQTKRPSCPLIICAMFVGVVTIVMPYTHLGKTLFQLVPLSKSSFIFVISLVIIYFICTEIVKYAYYQLMPSNNNQIKI